MLSLPEKTGHHLLMTIHEVDLQTKISQRKGEEAEVEVKIGNCSFRFTIMLFKKYQSKL